MVEFHDVNTNVESSRYECVLGIPVHLNNGFRFSVIVVPVFEFVVPGVRVRGVRVCIIRVRVCITFEWWCYLHHIRVVVFEFA